METFIYFLKLKFKSTGQEIIKIGFTNNPQRRLKELKKQHNKSKNIEIFAIFTGDKQGEAKLHHHFKHLNILGDYYLDTFHEIEKFVKNVEEKRKNEMVSEGRKQQV